jgi:hypothetical protein
MATVRIKAKKPPTRIDRFLGLNQNTDGETGLDLGESPYMMNFKITPNYNLKKRAGQINLFSPIGSKIQGMWYGKIKGTHYFLFACNGHIYKLENNVYTSIGTLANDITTFFALNNKVYIMNGHEYYSWNGTTFQTVEGYIPTLTISTPPAGGGKLFEEKNLLTDWVKQSFSGDGSKREFKLIDKNIQSDKIKATVNGVEKKEGTDFTLNRTEGKVTFNSTPSALPDNVVITFKMKATADRQQVTKCRYNMFYGGSNDTRVHLWGNSDLPNRRIYSELADGQPSAEYFGINSYSDVGSDEFAITDIVLQYDRQVIFTNGRRTYTSTYTTSMIDGKVAASFPTKPINDAVGNVAFNQVRIIRNYPVSLQNGVRHWTRTDVRDEKDENLISKKVQASLNNVDLTKAVTCDFEEENEYWLCAGSTVWIWNYNNNCWYMYNNIPARNFIVIKGVLHYGTNDGRIVKFDKYRRNDNGKPINCVWEMGFYDFDYETTKKYMSNAWVSIKPATRTTANVAWQTNNDRSKQDLKFAYNLATFKHASFRHWSFNTNYNPQPLHKKLKAKKFIYFKLIVSNNTSDEVLTLLSINLKTRLGAENK